MKNLSVAWAAKAVFTALLLTAAAGPSHAGDTWEAGAARVSITPKKPVWLAGYGRRAAPAQGTSQELYARALALKDGRNGIAVVVTTDMLGFPRDLAQRVAKRAEEEFQVARGRLLLNSSHTHAGPVVGRMFANAYLDMTEADWRAVDDYTSALEDKLVGVIGEAAGLAPAAVRSLVK